MEMEEEGGKFEVSVPTSHDQTQNKANQSVLPKVLYANMDNSVGKSTLISVKLNTSSVAAENSDALFGPWMVANTRRQRQQSSSTGNKPTVVSCLRAATGFEGGDEQRMATDMGAVPPRVVLNVAYRASKPNKKSKAAQVVAAHADLDPGRSIKVVVPPDDNRDAIQHMDGNVIPLRHYQPMALD
ncbi:hypothetical protein V6N13_015102 [Hibiscus sabdariffa]